MWYARRLMGNKKNIIGVEVGVDQALHAWEILDQWDEIDMLHLVDSYSTRSKKHYNDALKKLEKFNKRTAWYVQPSLEAYLLFDDNSLDVVYLDASHVYIDVLQDCIAWYKKLKPGGVLCGHDYRLDWNNMDEHSASFINAHGVVKAVNEFVILKNDELKINKIDKEIVLGTKTDGSSSDWWIKKC